MRLESPAGRMAAALAVMLGSVAIAGCTGSSDSAGSGTTLTWFVFPEPGGAYDEAAKVCTESSEGEYNIQIELLPTDADGQREQLVRRLGAEDSSIDIIGMDVIWTAEFANAGWIKEWTGDLAEEVTDDVFESVIESATFEDKLYGAPFTSNTQLLWYRKDRVEQVPETWEDMIAQAEEIGEGGTIQVQADRYEALTVWFNSLTESAGGAVLAGPEEIDLPEEPATAAIEVMGSLAASPAAAPNFSVSTEDTARLGFEAGDSAFMVNYPFVFPSAKENAPDVFKQMEAAPYPAVVEGEEAAPPLGGINLGVSAFSENPELAFEAAACMRELDNQVTAAELGGLPPTIQAGYSEKRVKDAYPGFSDLIKQAIDAAAPRPVTPAYTDVSLAIQRALHPPDKIDPADPSPIYDELRSNLDDGVKREGLL